METSLTQKGLKIWSTSFWQGKYVEIPGIEMDLDSVLSFLRKHNLNKTEDLLKDEFKSDNKSIPKSQDSNHPDATTDNHDDVKDQEESDVLRSYKSDEKNPLMYSHVYRELESFVERSVDLYKPELSQILYPVFVHMYLELVYNGHEGAAMEFIKTFGSKQESFYEEDVQKLSYMTKPRHMRGSELIENFQTAQFTVRMSRDTYTQLRKATEEIHGIARNKKQIAATSGGMVGEANRQANRQKVYYGLLREPDLSAFTNTILMNEPDEEDDGEGDKPKKKKLKRDAHLKRQKNDPNAPVASRMPFPDLRDTDKAEKARALKESLRESLWGQNVFLPILGAGFSDAAIKVWSLLPSKLKVLKSADELGDINRDADDVLHRMMEDNSGVVSRTLYGHSGPVYGISFSPDKSMLLSCSEDGTIRLWSLQTWTCLVCYRGHMYAVWHVKFSPQGYYFASAGHDKTVMLWSTEQHHSLRIFAGHFSDVDCIAFHPNCNYIASGSSDRSVRVWDCVSGNCVRLMTGHKTAVSTLAFSPDGRFLASGGRDSRVLFWDIAHGHLLADLSNHSQTVTALAFSRDGNILASSSTDFGLAMWDFQKLINESSLEDVNVAHNPDVRTDSKNLLVTSYSTKTSPILHLHFTRRNLLLSVGPYCG
ncbi:TAF5 [Lepeophtheirus salmonis]|uniref:Transcription initiation factor TFIID subunit 5 n=1 Tax=Lepeophtheirus salmonis TaxID=72036 RepID=A0A7R8HB95_LEPSM|nr:TAF5 [Lepeophtheirus salmonis]CAF2978075.1 TAF5 [Lepeophtheirus salmonis]